MQLATYSKVFPVDRRSPALICLHYLRVVYSIYSAARNVGRRYHNRDIAILRADLLLFFVECALHSNVVRTDERITEAFAHVSSGASDDARKTDFWRGIFSAEP
jgi:hypothetical protein